MNFKLVIKNPKRRSGHHDFRSKNCLVHADRRTKRSKTRGDQKRNWQKEG